MDVQKIYHSKPMKVGQIIFFILWIIGIFIGGKFIVLLVTILGLYSVIWFRQVGIEAMKQQRKLNKWMSRLLKHPDSSFRGSSVTFTQVMFLIGGLIMIFFGLNNFLFSK